MPIDEETLLNLLPKFPPDFNKKAEREIYLSLRKMYEYIQSLTYELENRVNANLDANLSSVQETQNQMISNFASQLIGGDNQSNPLAVLGIGSVTNVDSSSSVPGLTLNTTNQSSTPHILLSGSIPSSGGGFARTFMLMGAC